MSNIDTARIFKEEIDNPAIWDTIIRDLELPEDTDEITVKSVTFDSPTKRKKVEKGKQNVNSSRT